MPRMAIGEWETHVHKHRPADRRRRTDMAITHVPYWNDWKSSILFPSLSHWTRTVKMRTMKLWIWIQRDIGKRRTAINANNWTQWSKSIDSFNSCANSRTLALFLEMQPPSRAVWTTKVNGSRRFAAHTASAKWYLINFYMQDDVVARRCLCHSTQRVFRRKFRAHFIFAVRISREMFTVSSQNVS